MKKLITLCFITSTIFFISCGPSDNKQLSDLQKENAELKAKIEKLSGRQMKSASQLTPITYTSIKDNIANLYNANNIKIPVSWTFEEDQLKIMLDAYNEQDIEAKGLMAYSMNENGFLKLALVPYYYNINGTDTQYVHFPENVISAYNFSDMCPPNRCAYNDDLFGIGNNPQYYEFHK